VTEEIDVKNGSLLWINAARRELNAKAVATGPSGKRAQASTRAGKPPEKCDSRIPPLVTIGLDAHLALSLFARLEALNRRIPTPPQSDVDPLQHDVVDFETLLERDLA
jgi:hypothetical protein